MGDNYNEFCKSAEKAKNNDTCFTFFNYSENLRYDSEGIYSYGSKIAHLDLDHKTILKIGHLSFPYNNHHNYALHVFHICYDFQEVSSLCLHPESSGPQPT